MKVQIKKYFSDLNTQQKEVAGLVLFLIVVIVFFFRPTEQVVVKKIVEPDLLITSKTVQPEIISDLAELSVDTLNDIWPPLSQPWTGDLDGMLDQERIRILTPFSLGSYYIDHGQQRGTNYEFSRLLEKFIKKKFGKEAKELKVIIIPVRRDQLIPYVIKGYGDIIMGSLTITDSRKELIDFASPISDKIKELLVTGPASPEINSIDDLSGQEVAVSLQSSFYETLMKLNKTFKDENRPEIKIIPVDPRLEREDILEMVHAGLLPMTVHDSHVLKLWREIYKDLVVHDDMPLKENSEIAMALRKDSPQLKKLLDEFSNKHRLGTLTTNVIFNRYFKDTKWVNPALEREPFRKLEELVFLFKKYGEKYNFDWVLLASFANQESRFDQKAKSKAGAIGIMQVLPSTAADKSVGIKDISTLENNIHAGTKYLSVLRDTYFNDDQLDDFERTLFTMAGYNAGPSRIRRLRKEAENRGLDPNKWFKNVEYVAASRIGREPVVYVGNIFQHYVAYKRSLKELEVRRQVKQTSSQ
jgi:membrane-bound lytic murein transglycosylase MltF